MSPCQLGCESWQEKRVVIGVLFQQNSNSGILDAGKSFSSWQWFQVEGFDNIPNIFLTPELSWRVQSSHWALPWIK